MFKTGNNDCVLQSFYGGERGGFGGGGGGRFINQGIQFCHKISSFVRIRYKNFLDIVN